MHKWDQHRAFFVIRCCHVENVFSFTFNMFTLTTARLKKRDALQSVANNSKHLETKPMTKLRWKQHANMCIYNVHFVNSSLTLSCARSHKLVSLFRNRVFFVWVCECLCWSHIAQLHLDLQWARFWHTWTAYNTYTHSIRITFLVHIWTTEWGFFFFFSLFLVENEWIWTLFRYMIAAAFTDRYKWLYTVSIYIETCAVAMERAL